MFKAPPNKFIVEEKKNNILSIGKKKSSETLFKLPSEIERWAYSNDSTDEVRHGYDPEDFESIDDSYLDKFDQDSNEKKVKINRLEQKQKIIEVLRQCKSRKDSIRKQKKKEDDFNEFISNVISANSNLNLADSNDQMKKNSLENHSIIKVVEEQQHRSTEEEENLDGKKVKSFRRNESSRKFNTVNSGISRAMPGSLQQNITIERNFFKDLLKLSKQRYISKLNTEFQKKRFINDQARKGLFKENDLNLIRSQSCSAPRPSLTSNQVVNEKTKQLHREIKSISAFAKRRTDSALERYLGIDNQSNDLTKTKSDLISNYNRVILDDYSGDETNEVQEILGLQKNGILNQKKLKSNVKRPNTTLAISHTTAPSSSRLNHSNSTEVKYQLNVNKYHSTDNNTGLQHYMLSNPISDERFKGLIKSMSNYKPNKDIDRPDLLVRHLIDSNKALQKPGVAMCEKNDKRNALIELNMKLFEKIVSDI